jgi:hypothetical protein
MWVTVNSDARPSEGVEVTSAHVAPADGTSVVDTSGHRCYDAVPQ